MLRNSNYLFLQVNNSIIIIPWVNNAPDFSSLEEPALSITQKAWQDFWDSGQELEVIPDTEPIIETSSPNWDGLYQALMVSSAYQSLATLALDPTTSIVDVPLNKVVAAILYGIQRPDSIAAIPAFQSAVNLLLYVLAVNQLTLTSEQLIGVRQLLDANGFTSIQLG